MKFNKTIILLAGVSSIFLACSNNDDLPEVINEEELITTVSATLIPQNGGETILLKSIDLDGGDGPNAPVISVSGNLTSDTNYAVTLEILNETEDPAENITLEILEEDEAHQFFYSFTNSLATTTYKDQDANGNPVGVVFDLVTGTAATGNFNITLKHEPNKEAANVSSGDITNASGETDVQVTFNLTVN
ncbi:type 1 periplasmic binding fold superfamily protein [uncultured Polaribacter sp.]|uniref:type 1 periplasmic binding fold superfamily protein n=1 Tax=uncultured Polaribacter sp. TaxID=174711 RepID=UPI0032B2B4C1|tara:strand:- start:5592 stop:6161 length:570 start_codon:yes stop_codon:yes gene_type:complete